LRFFGIGLLLIFGGLIGVGACLATAAGLVAGLEWPAGGGATLLSGCLDLASLIGLAAQVDLGDFLRRRADQQQLIPESL